MADSDMMDGPDGTPIQDNLPASERGSSLLWSGMVAAKFLDRHRLAVYPWLFIGVYVLMIVFGCLIAPGNSDRFEHPKGGDFVTFYAVSILAARGEPTAAYTQRVFEVEKQVSGSESFRTTWDYPPSFLLAMLPLSRLPYLAALGLWLAVTLWPYLAVLRRLAPHLMTTRLVLAFPGTFQNFIQGQNGFLTTALMGGGLLILESRPFVGGLILGLLTYKPQFAWLVVVALITGRRWRAIAGAAVSASVLAVATLPVFGVKTWYVFLTNLPVHSHMLAAGRYPVYKMPTVFAGARLLGVGQSYAYALQVPVLLGSIAAVIWVWGRDTTFSLRVAVLALASCLAQPCIFDYDLAVLALALVCISWEAHRHGWMPGEKMTVLLVWLTPFSSVVAQLLHLHVTPVILVLMLVLVLRRVGRNRAMAGCTMPEPYLATEA